MTDAELQMQIDRLADIARHVDVGAVLRRERDAAIIDLRDAGVPVSELADITGMSVPRLYQILENGR